ncbi:protein kinase family protein [Paenibacillus wenxiniae]|uniref:Protein kinase family protein n=1 Tax=Paenibacillus wenxiniae TaxID=1636843 RepID=A0ABW4RLU8_9BACL
MLVPGESVKFDSMRNFKYIASLGSGGTGDAHLLKDEIMDMLFAFKKYAPKGDNNSDDTYRRFVEEIEILFNISHHSIVRIFNYYLYPEFQTGYLQMEYVEGQAIDQYEPFFEDWWEDVFKEVIYAFEYLEEKKILHRDIRPANIMIDKNEKVKIIDFGFGKKLNLEETGAGSIFLNWPVTQLPNEIQLEGVYNHQSEIYFIGKLFQNILVERGLVERFKLYHIIETMTKLDPDKRYASFHNISQAISQGVLSEIDFTISEKTTYQNFADALVDHISYFRDKYDPINDIDIVLNRLGALIRSSSLETFIQDNSQFIKCFIKSAFAYKSSQDIQVKHIKSFYQLLASLDSYKQKIVLDNIQTRLGNIDISYNINEDDLPF